METNIIISAESFDSGYLVNKVCNISQTSHEYNDKLIYHKNSRKRILLKVIISNEKIYRFL